MFTDRRGGQANEPGQRHNRIIAEVKKTTADPDVGQCSVRSADVGFDKIYYGSRSRAAATDAVAAEVSEQDVVIGMRPSAPRYPVEDVIELERYLVSHRGAPLACVVSRLLFYRRLRFTGPNRAFGGRPDGHVMMELLLNDGGHRV